MRAGEEDFEGAILSLGRSLGHTVSKERATYMAAELAAGPAGYAERWTLQELAFAKRAVVHSAEVSKRASYDRTITPGLFAEARQRYDVQAGRLFDYDEARAIVAEYGAGASFGFDDAFRTVRVDGREEEVWLNPDGSPKALFALRPKHARKIEQHRQILKERG